MTYRITCKEYDAMSVEQKLVVLDQLLFQGTISKEVYEANKKQVLVESKK